MVKELDQDFLRELALTLDSLADKLLKGIEELKAAREHLERFYAAALSAHNKLLNATSRQLMEKEINKLLDEEDARQALTKKHSRRHNWGGISKEILNRG